MAFHDGTDILTEITAENAEINFGGKDIVFSGAVRIRPGERQLSANDVKLTPERWLLSVRGRYVMKMKNRRFAGEDLRTDIFLK